MSATKPAKNNKLSTVDEFEAAKLALKSEAMEEKRRPKKGFLGMNRGGATKPRLHVNADGDLKFRKKKGIEVDTGRKRKRGEVQDESNKRADARSRNFMPVRTRRAVCEEAMDMDCITESPSHGLVFA